MHVEIYTRSGCSYCNMAKELLQSKSIGYVEQKLDIDFTRTSLVEKFSSAKTYPVIVVDGFYIGGYTQLKYLLEQRESDQRKLLTEE
jgi:glutaredoxin 3